MRVPLDQVIYVGDGLTDMPCFSVLFRANGIALGVGGEKARKKWGRAAEAAGKKAGRVSNLAAADFRDGSELMDSLLLAVESIGTRIAIRQKAWRD